MYKEDVFMKPEQSKGPLSKAPNHNFPPLSSFPSLAGALGFIRKGTTWFKL